MLSENEGYSLVTELLGSESKGENNKFTGVLRILILFLFILMLPKQQTDHFDDLIKFADRCIFLHFSVMKK